MFVYFVHPKPEIPQSKFRCFHSSISLTKCLSHLLWVTTLKDLQKKKKQTNKLMYCQETADSSCGIDHAEWDLCLLHTSAPGTLAEREHRRTYSAVTGRLSSPPCSRHLPRCKSTVPHRHLSQRSYRLRCDGALTPIHLAWSVSWKQTPAACVLHVRGCADGVARESKFTVEVKEKIWFMVVIKWNRAAPVVTYVFDFKEVIFKF